MILRSIPKPTPVFTGREDILEKISNFFNVAGSSMEQKERLIFVLYGLGGAGKTQIARRFITGQPQRFVV